MENKIVLEKIENIKPTTYIDIKDVLPNYSKILSENLVTEPIITDTNTNVVLSGHKTLFALQLLGAKKVPIIKVNLLKLKVKGTTPSGEPITPDHIIRAGQGKSKLPLNSFNIILDKIPKINISLDELGVWEFYEENKSRVYNSTLELLYKNWPTPLVRLNSFSDNNKSVWAKLEGFNPFSNSVKDRIGWAMIIEAIEHGELGDILYEATSTNTGIALTSIANMLGKRTKLFIPKSIQKVSDTFLKVLGAEVVRMPVSLTVEAINDVENESRRDGATHLNQFENDANFKVHLKYTAKELDYQLRSKGLIPTHIIGGLGTSGHMSAISLYFKSKYNDKVKIIGVQPAPDEIIPGIRRIESGMKWCHWVKFDEIVDVTRDEAIEMAINVARKEGILIGLSSGAVTSALTKIAEDDGVYVLVYPDTGYKYAEQFEEYFQKKKGSH